MGLVWAFPHQPVRKGAVWAYPHRPKLILHACLGIPTLPAVVREVSVARGSGTLAEDILQISSVSSSLDFDSFSRDFQPKVKIAALTSSQFAVADSRVDLARKTRGVFSWS